MSDNFRGGLERVRYNEHVYRDLPGVVWLYQSTLVVSFCFRLCVYRILFYFIALPPFRCKIKMFIGLEDKSSPFPLIDLLLLTWCC